MEDNEDDMEDINDVDETPITVGEFIDVLKKLPKDMDIMLTAECGHVHSTICKELLGIRGNTLVCYESEWDIRSVEKKKFLEMVS